MRLLLLTNDFPPRAGGIQQYSHNLVSRLDPATVTVCTSSWVGAEEFDARQGFRVVRHPSSNILPTRAVLDWTLEIASEVRPDVVVFSAAFPLGLLAGRITRATRVPCMAFTHGVEVGVARLPLVRRLMVKIARDLRLLTAVSEWSAQRLATVAGAGRPGTCAVELLVSGVSIQDYAPSLDGSAIRERHGLGGRPVCVCVSRLVARKGQDRLIDAWPAVVARVPGAGLLLVGGGPAEQRLRRRAAASPVSHHISFTGEVPWSALGEHYAAGDVFAMPCRTRLGGLDVEALGAVFLEAAAVGLPVVAGRSGGAPETVDEGVTGFVVDGRRTDQIAGAVAKLLANPAVARSMGMAGRRRVEQRFAWEAVVDRFSGMLDTVASQPAPPAAVRPLSVTPPSLPGARE